MLTLATPPAALAAGTPSPDDLLDTRSAAPVVGLAPATLELDRCRRRLGIPFIRCGRAIRYRRGDLLAWLNSHRVEG